MIKETDEQPGDNIGRVRSVRVLNTGTFVRMKLGCITFPGWVCLHTWKLSEPPTIGILWRLLHMGMINY